MNKIKIKFLLVFLPVLMTLAYAGVTGKISGNITDAKTGEVLLGANIMIVEKMDNGNYSPVSRNMQIGSATDADGDYYILNIPPGIYSVKYSYIGYQSIIQRDIRVSSDMTTTVNCELSATIIKASGAVIVTSQRKAVKIDLTSSEVSMGADIIETLPVRSVSDMITLQAGVIKDASGNLHIRGGRSSEISYMVDGVQIVDPLNRSAGINIDDQSIEELKTITGTFNAEYGQALSGVVNIITKQGSDKFKMNITGYFGDHFSTDDDLYYVMDNKDWANSAATALSRKDRYLSYNFEGKELEEDFISEKIYHKKEAYLNKFNPIEHKDIQANISGPVAFTNKRLTYYISGRYTQGPGYSYGKRYFMPWGIQAPASDTENDFDAPDNEIVPLNWSKGFSSQSKLFFELTKSMRMSYGVYLNSSESYGVGYNYKYVPDAGKNNFNNSMTQILSLKHSLSPKTFYEAKISKFDKKYEGHLYDTPENYQYMPTQSGDLEQYVFDKNEDDIISVTTRNNDFRWYGNNVEFNDDDVSYYSLKFDITSQVNKRHLIKTGISYTDNDIKRDYFQLQFSDDTYRPIVPDENSPFHVNYKATPKEFAAYLQDKIEFNELIINIGVRYDYFDSDGKVLSDPLDPQIYSPFKFDHIYSNYEEGKHDSLLTEYTIEEREEFWYKDAKAKSHLSPRFGLSFPITDKGVIHFSYGHFFQNPQLRYLYTNPNFWITGAGAENLVGNCDISAERTVMYEVGLQQELMEGVFLHVTGFYRDIRDWVGTGIPIDTYRGETYVKYDNKDHAAAKGITITNNYRFGNFSLNMDYTYMTAVGTSSDPRDAYNDMQSDRAPRVTMINLNWDQRHSFSSVLTYSNKGWTGTMIGTLNSGLPYTPSFARGEKSGSGTFIGLRENSERKPSAYNVDFRLSKSIKIAGIRGNLFCNVQNLFDIRNVRNVYSDTGKADFTLNGVTQVDRDGDPNSADVEISNVDEYFTRPGNYSAPRFIQLGFRLSI